MPHLASLQTLTHSSHTLLKTPPAASSPLPMGPLQDLRRWPAANGTYRHVPSMARVQTGPAGVTTLLRRTLARTLSTKSCRTLRL
jgi:hypothetical protein